MRIVVQRSKYSTVTVNEEIVGQIDFGIVLLVSFTHQDTPDDIIHLVKKVVNLRIFDDENHMMNKSLLDVGGKVLSISQFTLYGDVTKGNRPSYIASMKASEAVKMYDIFNEELKKYVVVETGVFQAEMIVNITNDGPVTILLESNHD